MSKKIAIVGAGLAGLSSGIYLQKEGFQTEIFEMAGWSGGVCTAWIRKGYRFDGCIHWMVGTQPGNDFYDLYREVDALDEDTPIFNTPSLIQELDGNTYEIPLAMPEFNNFLFSIAPEDIGVIHDFCKDLQLMIDSKMPAGTPSSIKEIFDMMKNCRGFLKVMPKYMKTNVGKFCSNFQNPTLKALLLTLMPGNFSMSAFFMMLSTRMSGNAGYPMGGALDLIKRMEEKYRSLGGAIHFGSKVEKIDVENDKAIGIQVKGKYIPVDGVIVASDAHDLLHNLLEGKYKHPQLDTMLNSFPLFEPLALVSFGVDRKFGIPFSHNVKLEEEIEIFPGIYINGFNLRAFDFDPSAAPDGCSSVMVMFTSPLEYWNDLRKNDIESYKHQKMLMADKIADALDAKYPGFKASIQVTDVATPATYVHLANLYKGSFEGFLPTPDALTKMIKKTIPGIKNLVLCGQWTTAGGGICTAINSGKEASGLIHKVL